MNMSQRTAWQKFKDTITLPIRPLFLFEGTKFGLSSIKNERLEYAAREVLGYCLDIGCGRGNEFVAAYLHGNGVGIDVFPYEGLSPDQIVTDMTHLPFPDRIFHSVTFIANVNHIPADDRIAELREAYRCLKPKGNCIITMPSAIAGILVHKFVHAYDRVFGTTYDVDTVRGMHCDEEYFLRDRDIIGYLQEAGFSRITKKYFGTQWGMNHLFVGWKR